MTYRHLSINELVIIEAYYQIGKKVIDIAKALNRSRQTIYKVIAMLKRVTLPTIMMNSISRISTIVNEVKLNYPRKSVNTSPFG
ncbi:helix-turn-helix domain-containing protein [Pelistega ratti]|uniref:helix-turn-helix domain-containing protein n=1 Tax=Pelistega ratti TaxID=2652177 RepID=UPI001954B642